MKNDCNENKYLQEYDGRQIVSIKKDIDKKIEELTHILNYSKITDQEKAKYIAKISSILQTTGSRADKISDILLVYRRVRIFRIKDLQLIVDILLGLLLISLGFAMIIIPAPFPAFEIATLFYFNEQDGVTVMDLISLVIIFFGSKVIIETFSKTS